MRFITGDGVPVPAVTGDTMREIDRIAMEETGPNLFQMMENAGRTLAGHVMSAIGPHWRDARVVVVAGGGGNGGGGICAARHLANRDIDVVLALSNPAHLGHVPAFQRTLFASTRGREVLLPALDDAKPDMIIDALIGYGLRQAPHGRTAEMIAWANDSGAPILALDVPSGLNATTGERPGACIRPRMTLTLALPKTGLATEHVGEVWLADLGIPRATFTRAGLEYVNPFGDRYRVRLTQQHS